MRVLRNIPRCNATVVMTEMRNCTQPGRLYTLAPPAKNKSLDHTGHRETTALDIHILLDKPCNSKNPLRRKSHSDTAYSQKLMQDQ